MEYATKATAAAGGKMQTRCLHPHGSLGAQKRVVDAFRCDAKRRVLVNGVVRLASRRQVMRTLLRKRLASKSRGKSPLAFSMPSLSLLLPQVNTYIVTMAAIGSLVFCTDCGNLLDGSAGKQNAILTCQVCGASCKGNYYNSLRPRKRLTTL